MNTSLRICAILIFLTLLCGCSSTGNSPVVPSGSADQQITTGENITGVPVESSDVLYSRSSSDVLAYKAFGIYDISIDTQTLTGEIIPARNASAIGDVFDSDLTQFLIKTPCYNCIRIDGISNPGDDQIQVGFAIKHPFGDITKRPDLHGFDVRGILLSKGNWGFPSTIVRLGEMSFTTAEANVSLLANADGYTQHFDSLAEDTHYFDPPKYNYDANINPYKRYFENPSVAAFDPNNPVGHNVMKTGASWETQYYVFNVPQGATALDFGFIVDCSYGVSAKFSNRFTPYYFLPEFNRKEAWKVEASIISNDLESGNTTSTAQIKVEVCDWQAGLAADPNYPDTTNLSGISADSDVASVSVDLANVATLSEVTSPVSGSGTYADPYIFNLTVTNSQGAVSGWYYALIAVRDDLQGQQGPIGIPESPAGFPFEGPDIYDYSTYQVLPIRISGTPPDITSATVSTPIAAGDQVPVSADISEWDGDDLIIQWEQISPASPVGIFDNASIEDPIFVVPDFHDVAMPGITFTLRLTVSDIDGTDTQDVVFTASPVNTPPVCYYIMVDPYLGIINPNEELDITVVAYDLEGDSFTVQWDFDYRDSIFDVEATGLNVTHSWATAGVRNVACRLTETIANPLVSICQRTIVVEGIFAEDFKVDASGGDPDFKSPDISVSEIGNSWEWHSSWLQSSTYDIYYTRAMMGAQWVVYDTPATSIVFNQKIASQGDTVIVAWNEQDTIPNPDVYYLKTITSLDGGDTWGTPVTVVSKLSPDNIGEMDIHEGNSSGQFIMFYEALESAQIKNYFVHTSNNGSSWNYPAGGGQFRDSFGVGDYVNNPMIRMNPDGVLFAYWHDGRVNPGFYMLDWSEDFGQTWNSDLQISDNVDALVDGDMAIDDNGIMYFAWLRDVNAVKMITADFDTEPNLNPPILFYSTGANLDEISLYVGPNGQSIFVGLVQMVSFKMEIRMLHSLDGGNQWNTDYTISHSTGDCIQLAMDGHFFGIPDGNELVYLWNDDRDIAGPEGHIYGNVLVKADRP
jgi:hypothetical protein